jgi:F0F1-type ATP synthase assembly protein I
MLTHNEGTPKLYNSPGRKTQKAHPSSGFTSLARTYRDVAPYLGLGIQLAATIVVCFFIGRWLDQILNTAPWLMIVGAFLGAGGGLYNFLRTVIELGKKEKERQKLVKDAQP